MDKYHKKDVFFELSSLVNVLQENSLLNKSIRTVNPSKEISCTLKLVWILINKVQRKKTNQQNYIGLNEYNLNLILLPEVKICHILYWQVGCEKNYFLPKHE
jgi:hypothetical protein